MYISIPSLTSALAGGRCSTPCPCRFTSGKDPVPIVQEEEWAPGPVWTAAENLAHNGIRSPDRPARSEQLFRPICIKNTEQIKTFTSSLFRPTRIKNTEQIRTFICSLFRPTRVKNTEQFRTFTRSLFRPIFIKNTEQIRTFTCSLTCPAAWALLGSPDSFPQEHFTVWPLMSVLWTATIA